MCVSQDDVSGHIPHFLCPVHAIWPQIEKRVGEGKRVFSDGIAKNTAAWMKIALKARNVPSHDLYTLHSMRRGAAQTLIEGGGGLSVLLRAGSWRSSAFKCYINAIGIEDKVVSSHIGELVNSEDED